VSSKDTLLCRAQRTGHRIVSNRGQYDDTAHSPVEQTCGRRTSASCRATSGQPSPVVISQPKSTAAELSTHESVLFDEGGHRLSFPTFQPTSQHQQTPSGAPRGRSRGGAYITGRTLNLHKTSAELWNRTGVKRKPQGYARCVLRAAMKFPVRTAALSSAKLTAAKPALDNSQPFE
jgi:hypothetical protein